MLMAILMDTVMKSTMARENDIDGHTYIWTIKPLLTASGRPIGGVLAVALLWELGEFLSNQWLGTHIQVGPLDTSTDLALGTAGALVAAGVTTVWQRARHE